MSAYCVNITLNFLLSYRAVKYILSKKIKNPVNDSLMISRWLSRLKINLKSG